MIEVLRLGHRISRDKRISTHVGLTARAFGAKKLYYSGQKDSDFEKSVNKIVDRFGGNFKTEYCKNYRELINKKKKENFILCHLTMYGIGFEKKLKELKNKKVLVIVGGEKVPYEIYELSDFNLSVSLQPISEVSALGIFLYKLHGKAKFKDSKVYVVESERGKILKTIK